MSSFVLGIDRGEHVERSFDCTYQLGFQVGETVYRRKNATPAVMG